MILLRSGGINEKLKIKPRKIRPIFSPIVPNAIVNKKGKEEKEFFQVIITQYLDCNKGFCPG